MIEPVDLNIDGGVLVVTLNRPDVRNAINLAVVSAVVDALRRLDAESDLRAAVLTGAGATFSAGMDIRAFVATQDEGVAERALGRIVRARPRKPLVAAVEGMAVGGGLELALCCDLIVAARGACFALPEAKLSLVASGGGLMRLPRRLPFGIAMEMALTGNFLSAEHLQGYGLVNRLVEPGKALHAALELAHQVASNGPLAVAAVKQLMWGQLDGSTEEFWALQDTIVQTVNSSADAHEGVQAFLEKRTPVWRGD